jgi:alkylation response protein AidB-like acyl-CoA dehydrogenase
MTATETTSEELTDEMLARFEDRAATYDRENRFFQEDFEELQASGYLRIAVPEKFGGPGLRLSEVLALQRRLAYVAPATALGTNMHLYWTGVAADLHRAGDSSCDWLLERAAAGDVFAAGHGEAGNDMPLFYSSTRAEQVEGGWKITGHKIFGTLTPVWTYLGLHAMDSSDPANLRIVHAFMPRDT